ncbi:MAG: hypothetical protein JW720_02050 [Sedimentisphaerales bacterium]|nr:hypothetical protein [Sedimentisphaerales bacterium]
MKELANALDNPKDVSKFRIKFDNSTTESIDFFMARNPKLAPVGKCFIAFEIFDAERRSLFREKAAYTQWKQEQERIAGNLLGGFNTNTYLQSKDFQGGDWYSYLFHRLAEGLIAKDILPDFSGGKLAFVTFNYDRSLEHFLYESVRNSFTEVPQQKVIECLTELPILHVYGRLAPLKWQDPEAGIDYRPSIAGGLIKQTAQNIRTIYEERESAELAEAHRLIKSAQQIFFLGLGYARENMDVLKLPGLIHPNCEVYGTGFGMTDREIATILNTVRSGRNADSDGYKERCNTNIEPCDCLELLRKHL